MDHRPTLASNYLGYQMQMIGIVVRTLWYAFRLVKGFVHYLIRMLKDVNARITLRTI